MAKIVDWRINITSGAELLETRDIALLQAALDQAWEFLPSKRRTRQNRDAMTIAIVRLAEYGVRDQGMLSMRALSLMIPEVPFDVL